MLEVFTWRKDFLDVTSGHVVDATVDQLTDVFRAAEIGVSDASLEHFLDGAGKLAFDGHTTRHPQEIGHVHHHIRVVLLCGCEQQSIESAFVSIQRGHLPAIWPTWWPWNRIGAANLATDEVSEGFAPVSIL
jgi:hypothetical protein